MKLTALFLWTFTMTASATDCSLESESYVTGAGYTQPGKLIAIDSDNLMHYLVRAGLDGGDSAYEVIVNQKCEYISHRLIWSD